MSEFEQAVHDFWCLSKAYRETKSAMALEGLELTRLTNPHPSILKRLEPLLDQVA